MQFILVDKLGRLATVDRSKHADTPGRINLPLQVQAAAWCIVDRVTGEVLKPNAHQTPPPVDRKDLFEARPVRGASGLVAGIVEGIRESQVGDVIAPVAERMWIVLGYKACNGFSVMPHNLEGYEIHPDDKIMLDLDAEASNVMSVSTRKENAAAVELVHRILNVVGQDERHPLMFQLERLANLIEPFENKEYPIGETTTAAAVPIEAVAITPPPAEDDPLENQRRYESQLGVRVGHPAPLDVSPRGK